MVFITLFSIMDFEILSIIPTFILSFLKFAAMAWILLFTQTSRNKGWKKLPFQILSQNPCVHLLNHFPTLFSFFHFSPPPPVFSVLGSSQKPTLNIVYDYWVISYARNSHENVWEPKDKEVVIIKNKDNYIHCKYLI